MPLRQVFCVAAVLAGLAAPAAHAAGLAPRAGWVVNGQVNAVVPGPDGTAFIGGSFDAVAPQSGGAAAIDPSGGAVDRTWPRFDAHVSAVVADGAGGWYVGGDFGSVGGVPRAGLA